MNDMYVIKDGKRLRCGYTTGSCAAAAAKACVMMLAGYKKIPFVEIDTPSGVKLKLEIKNQHIDKGYASCCVVKDGGDDPDATDGMEIYARVSKRNDCEINIDGGEGIGRITKPGFWGEAGSAAINPVPRKMIQYEIRKVSKEGFDVLIYAPLGAEVGKRTFNENIGIEGGISIIGTSGIVKPMSEEALLKTIYLEIDSVYDEGRGSIILFPGNYGQRVAEGLKLEGGRVMISNYVGDSLLYCYNKGFKNISLVGHIGKLSKLSIGAFNTHSRVCDVRMEAFVYYLALSKAPFELIDRVRKCTDTEEALEAVKTYGFLHVIEEMKKGCIHRIRRYVRDDNFQINLYMYSMKYGVF